MPTMTDFCGMPSVRVLGHAVSRVCFRDDMLCLASRRLRTVGPRLACPSCESVNTPPPLSAQVS